ncbi:deoxyribonuclease IV [Candidatus Methylomirabilis limnetica]|jgi:deoxyribonuclease-4|uniref:Probable endonuclease 4 n=1 Tax=Candidatus Methylomirabilis limnetica TaxID=2033718 RepID=A0A2T4U1H9_9BACT|nr:deoxyribonuclease IV [Candidatus Methylomirabilis limnetica]PTL37212.1 deoxyribonuclease IV [Candidatus Methylomirabilis limnetica]
MTQKPQQFTETDLLLGAHMSIAGGVDLAPLRGQQVGCRTIQLFTKSSNQWRARSLPSEEIDRFRTNLQAAAIAPAVAHGAYLINLASTDPALHQRSMAACLEELERAEALGIPYLVIHPGAHMGAGEDAGLRQVANSLRELLKRTKGCRVQVVLETTAGQGTALGHRFEHLALLLDQIGLPERTGVCMDTCHLFAAGYDIRTLDDYHGVLRAFDQIVGMPSLKVIHVNDCKKELGCRVDRHEHIGKGTIGLEAFRYLVTDPRLRGIPMIIETPKGSDFVTADRRNLETLRGLAEEQRAE